jgi:DNA-binding response OmpR family regulator
MAGHSRFGCDKYLYMVAKPLGRILVIDDDPNIVDMVIDYFGSSGYAVIGAHHGGDGLMLAEHEQPDVVLLDLRMAGLTGVEVLQQMKLRWPELPVVIVSGAGDVALAKRCLSRGALDYVSKPFNWEYLHRCVTAALNAAEVVVPDAAARVTA